MGRHRSVSTTKKQVSIWEEARDRTLTPVRQHRLSPSISDSTSTSRCPMPRRESTPQSEWTS